MHHCQSFVSRARIAGLLSALVALSMNMIGCGQSQANAAPPKAPVLASKFSAEQIAAAKKHPAYATLYDAQLIVVGKVSKVEGPTIELPGIDLPGRRGSEFAWILKPTQHLYVNKEHASQYDSYNLNGRVPDADLDKTPYLLARTFGERQVLFEPADKAMLEVAGVAIEQRRHDDAVLMHQAKHDPTSHPLFKAIRDARQVATVEGLGGYARTVSIDRNGVVVEDAPAAKGSYNVLVAANLRGKLPTDAPVGSYLYVAGPLAEPVEGQPLIVTWELRDGKAHATYIATMEEATLRIAAASMKREFDVFALDAFGPQSGSSRGSEGQGVNHHEDAPIGDGDPEADR